MDSRSRTEYSILNIIAGVGGYIVNTILGFICRMVFVKCLAADYLGVNGLFTNILTMLSLAELGIGGAIGFALYKPLAEDDKEKIVTIHSRPKPVKWKTKEIIFCLKANQRFSGRYDLSGCLMSYFL